MQLDSALIAGILVQPGGEAHRGAASVGVAWRFVAAAAAFLLLCFVPAQADTVGPDGRPLLLFAGTDVWRDGAFLYGGLLWSPGGFDVDGFTGIR